MTMAIVLHREKRKYMYRLIRAFAGAAADLLRTYFSV